jgi:hypothetical protein
MNSYVDPNPDRNSNLKSSKPDNAKVADIPVDQQGNVDFSKDFFGRRCCLTVSGQLNVETHACALSDVVSNLTL